MNDLLQKHGCSNVFTIPDGLRELMSDISREVLREQPSKICDFITNYLSALLVTRENGILAVKILEDLCDCKPSVSEHLLQLGFRREEAEKLSTIIKTEIEGFEPTEGKEKIKETELLKKIVKGSALDEESMVKVCQVARNAYRDFWYRKKLLEQGLKMQPDEPWEIAAEHTLNLYKKTKPSFAELTRATQKIQAAYKGYYIRKLMVKHTDPKPKKQGPRVELSGPPADAAASREIDLGPVIDIKATVREDDVKTMFDEHVSESLGVKYDPMKTITHVTEYPHTEMKGFDPEERRGSRMMPVRTEDGSKGATFAPSGQVSVIRDEGPMDEHVLEPKASALHKPKVAVDEEPNKVHAIPSQVKSEPPVGVASKVDTALEAKSATSRIDAKSATSQIDAKSATSQIDAKSTTSQIDAKSATSKIDAEPLQSKAEAVKSVTSAKSTVDEVPLEVIREPPEMPDDIADDQTEPDSMVTTSVPSSAPVSAATTDVEDAGVTDADDEGEE